MAESSSIEWCDSTFNPWIGCTKVGPGCDHCYAETSTPARALGVSWGPKHERHRTGTSNWAQPHRWERDHVAFAAQHGRRRRVFCASLADVFDNAAPADWRADLFELIARTPHLDWLLVTKRIGNVASMLKEVQQALWLRGTGTTWPLPNVWLGITVVNQAEVDRDVPKLIDASAQIRFLSIEPLLGPVRVLHHLMQGEQPGLCRACGQGHGFTRCNAYGAISPLRAPRCVGDAGCKSFERMNFAIDWVIAGGESGPAARPVHPAWLRSLRDQCGSAGVPFFFKQWGEWAPGRVEPGSDLGAEMRRGRTVFVHRDGSAPDGHGHQGDALMRRVGKAVAGRRLDGKLLEAWPRAAAWGSMSGAVSVPVREVAA